MQMVRQNPNNFNKAVYDPNMGQPIMNQPLSAPQIQNEVNRNRNHPKQMHPNIHD